MRRLSLLAASVALLAAAPLAAQAPPLPASSTRGFFAGAYLSGVSIDSDVTFGSASASGLGLLAGFGFSPHFAVLLDGSAGALDSDEASDATLVHFDILARYAFTDATRRFAPYVEGGITGIALIEEDVDLGLGPTEQATSGGGFTLGLGAQYYFSPKWAIGASLRWTSGQFTQVEANDVTISNLEIDARSTRFNLGITWYPTPNR